MNNFKFKVLEDEQFLELISKSRFLKAVRINKVLVRNTLDHYDKEPLYSSYNALYNSYKEKVDQNTDSGTILENWLEELYYNIKSYKEFFGLDVTKNVMVTIEYFDIIAGKHSITYIV